MSIENKIKSKLFKIAFKELLEGNWKKLNIKSLSLKSKLSVEETLSIITSKEELLDIWSHEINLKIMNLVSVKELKDVSKKDRILELMLCRLDVLEDYRTEIFALMTLSRENTLETCMAWSRINKAMKYIMNVSNIDTNGKKGMLKIKVLSIIWIITIKEWQQSKTKDNTFVMSNLDKRLTKIDKLNSTILN